MPLIKMQSSTALAPGQEETILKNLSDIVSKETGKPATVVMATIEQSPIMLAEQSGNAALFDIRGIGGLTQDVNTAITQSLCQMCKSELGIPPERVYANFTDVPRSNWGWNNKTF